MGWLLGRHQVLDQAHVDGCGMMHTWRALKQAPRYLSGWATVEGVQLGSWLQGVLEGRCQEHDWYLYLLFDVQ